MLQIERHNEILNLLQQKKSASIAKIASYTHSSVATVRRDLATLEKQGLVRRTHGGAILFESSNDESSTSVRMNENKAQKEKIATLTMPLLENGRTIFFDASSTVAILCSKFNLKYKTIITNGLQCALSLSEKENLTVIIPGGTVVYNSNSVCGSTTLKHLLAFNPDMAVFSCGGVCNGQVTEATMENAELKKTVLARAKIKILLVTASKFGKKLPFETALCDEFDYVITDSRPPYEEIEKIEKAKLVY